MYGIPKNSRAAVQRSAERRQREGDAPRLASEVPGLKSLRIEVVEHLRNGTTKHVKLIVVAHAPALFVIACGDADCRDGGHELTREVLWQLRAHAQDWCGTSNCQGSVGSGECMRRIAYHLRAEYV